MNAEAPHFSLRHFLALVAGALCIAFAPIFVVLSKQLGGIGMLDAAYWRVTLGAVALGLFMGVTRQPLVKQGTPLGMWIWLPGILFAGDFAVWHASFEHTSVANSTLLANLSLVLVTLFAWLFWKEKIRLPFVIGASLASVGAVLIIYSSSGRGAVVEGGNPVLGDFLGIATAFFYASYLLTTKGFRRNHAAQRLMFWSSSVASVCLLPFALLQPGQFLPDGWIGWLPLIGVGFISHAGGQGLIAYGLAGLPASLSAVTLLIQPMTTAFLGWLILGQELVPWQIAGGLAVLTGLAIAIRGQVRRAPTP